MLNLNSPTVQAMLENTPQGYGNMPVYYGNSPTVTQTQQPVNGLQTPFPSPKEMIMQGGQSMIYSPTAFAPRNIVGGYNPGYNAAFAGYSNPYMGYGAYGGYTSYMAPPDQDSRDRLDAANFNGISYDQQLEEESDLYKTISKIVSKNVGRSEERAKECEEAFNIYDKYPKEESQYGSNFETNFKPLHVKLKIGEDIVADMKPNSDSTTYRYVNYRQNMIYVDMMRSRQNLIEIEKIRRNNAIYENAPERMFDNTDLLDFFNNGAGILMADNMARILYEQSVQRTSQMYDSDKWKERLLKKNGLLSKRKLKAIERFAGRYGVMPDGRPVSPGHDPEIASSFSYNPQTGHYDVVAPNFIRDKLETARAQFIRSIGE